MDGSSSSTSADLVERRTGEGRQALQQLCAVTDVPLDRFRPSVLKALGLDPAQLWEVSFSLCNKFS
jgi:crotonobetainyl-CoA:carnitine CoA-transferase CaiB-like acyl-CoA transferase